MAPFHGWSSTASRLEPLRGGSLFFTTKFPEIHPRKDERLSLPWSHPVVLKTGHPPPSPNPPHSFCHEGPTNNMPLHMG